MKKTTLLVSCLFCMMQSFAQNVGIGTNTPDNSAILHVNIGADLKKGFLVTGVLDFNNFNGTVPDLGTGSRLMFYPAKGAFRAGYADGTQWNNANVGVVSTAFGFTTIASGISSTAMGTYTVASGDGSTAMGLNTRAKGFSSTVTGIYNDSILTIDQTAITNTTPLFIVGNGNSENSRSNAITILKNGNIGLQNNNAPDAPLSFGSNVGEKISFYTADSSKKHGIGLSTSPGSSTMRIYVPTNADSISFGFGSVSSFTQNMNLNGAGTLRVYKAVVAPNIGLQNNNAPDAPLSFGNVTGEKISFYSQSATQKHGIGLSSFSNFSAMRIYAPSSADYITFGYGSMSSFTQNMSLDGAGTLRVYKAVVAPNIGLQNNNAPDAPLSFANTAGEKVSFLTASATQKHGIGISSFVNFSAMRIYAPSAADYISFGYGSMSGFTENMSLDGGGTLRVRTAVVAPYAFSPSDQRLKQNIQPLTDPINRLMQIRGVTYQYSQPSLGSIALPNSEQVGLLAQDVEKVLPQAVTVIDSATQYKGVDYAKLVPLLVESIKAQQHQYEQQQKTIDEQQKMIEMQQKQIKALMDKVGGQ